MANDTLKIIFLGDITGRQGRTAVMSYVKSLKDNDSSVFVIANIENASHGFGLTKKNYTDLSECGINCFTSGNHIWDKKEIFNYIDNADKLLRPINYPNTVQGCGSKIFDFNGYKIAVISVLGRVFMNLVESQWEIVKAEIERIKTITQIIVIDFHAEATAEKICFAKYL